MSDKTESSYLTRHFLALGHVRPGMWYTWGTLAVAGNRIYWRRWPHQHLAPWRLKQPSQSACGIGLRSLLASRDPHLMHTGYRAHGGSPTAYFEGGPISSLALQVSACVLD
jgi:hypothetical protein